MQAFLLVPDLGQLTCVRNALHHARHRRRTELEQFIAQGHHLRLIAQFAYDTDAHLFSGEWQRRKMFSVWKTDGRVVCHSARAKLPARFESMGMFIVDGDTSKQIHTVIVTILHTRATMP